MSLENSDEKVVYVLDKAEHEKQFYQYENLCESSFSDKIPWFKNFNKIRNKCFSVLCLKQNNKDLIGGITIFTSSPESEEINNFVGKFVSDKDVFMSLLLSRKNENLHLPLLRFLSGLFKKTFSSDENIKSIWGVVESDSKLINVYKNKFKADIIDIPFDEHIKIVIIKRNN